MADIMSTSLDDDLDDPARPFRAQIVVACNLARHGLADMQYRELVSTDEVSNLLLDILNALK